MTDELATWTPIGSVATTNGVSEFVDQNARGRPLCFYRLKQPGVAVEEAEARWSLAEHSDYQFRLQHVRNYGEAYVLSANVTVTGSQKTVSNAVADGQPLDQPHPEDFPTVEELWAALQEAAQSGCWRVAVTCDEAAGYPVSCVIERLMPGGLPLPQKRIDEYRITSLTSTRNGSRTATPAQAEQRSLPMPTPLPRPGCVPLSPRT